ncbi:putative sterigmatocystin biosynthesis P450 monooxygenase STCB [Colletotrichum sp. SAR 10_77]|nr:putative sterigmatocystin biosynthesis P450 monooxygenase STCB [Colletotrichum sp. SAR 10_77]
MAPGTFSCVVHPYDSPTSNATAYEIGPSGSNAILFVGGLGDGPHTVSYTQTIARNLEAKSLDWSVFEIRMRSSFTGYGYSSLKNDVEDISALVRYLRGIGKKKIVLMGHSTGCQDSVEYTKHKEDPVDGFILQGPASDRESIVDFITPELYRKGVDLAEKMIAEGKAGEAMPTDHLPSLFDTPITAYRWHALAAKGGDDDYFSSDLDESFVSSVWQRFEQPVMALHSAKDEFVPAKIDKQALIDSWKKTSPKLAKATWRGCGQHIPSALSGVPEDQWCTCTPKVTVNGKEYPPAGPVSIPDFIMLLLSPVVLGAASVVLTLVYLARCVSSPLWRLPGPRASAFTSLLLKWHEWHAQRTKYIHRLHEEYGPVVRIAPNEVAFTSYDAVKEIYCSGGSGYDKTEFYNLFRHAKRKRIIADRYANSNVLRPAPLSGIQERSLNFIKRCEASVGNSHDIFMSLHSYACDCVTHHLFHPYGTNCLQDTTDEEMMHQVAADDSLQNRLIQHYSPALHKALSGVLYAFAKPRETPLADNFVMESSRQPDPAPFTLLSRLHEKSSDLDQTDKAGENLDHMAAGIDTTGDGLCFLMWELSQPRSMQFQERLQRELRENPGVSFDKLPFLDAVVQEGLRVFPAIPMSLPRLALAEMKILLSDIYSRYTTLPETSMTAESMAMSDQLISSRPLGQRCLLQFVPIAEKRE